jgi:hypothetical protein
LIFLNAGAPTLGPPDLVAKGMQRVRALVLGAHGFHLSRGGRHGPAVDRDARRHPAFSDFRSSLIGSAPTVTLVAVGLFSLRSHFSPVARSPRHSG